MINHGPVDVLVLASGEPRFDGGVLAGRLKDQRVLVSALDSTRLRLVTHNDVSRDQIYRAAEAFARCLQ